MNEKENRDKVFNFLVQELAFLDNNYDRLVYPNIKDSVIGDLKRFHGLDTDTRIIYYRDICPDKSQLTRLVISDIGISYRCSYKIFFTESKTASWNDTIKWEDISRVEYSEDSKYFYFYGSDGYNEYCRIQRKALIKKEGTSVCMKFAQILSQAAKMFVGLSELVDHVFQLEQEEKYDEALSIIDDLFKKEDLVKESSPFLHYMKGRVIYNSIPDDAENDDSKYHLAKYELETALKNLGEDYQDYKYIICYYLGSIYFLQDEDLKGRDYVIRAMDAPTGNLEMQAKEAFEHIESQLKELWKNYTHEIKYMDRQFIMPVREIKGCYDEQIKTFLMSNIPSCIQFPLGHPVANELYIGHPYKPNIYIPYNMSDELLFMDKVHELCYLLQCLGATELNIQSIKGKSVKEISKEESHFGFSANYKVYSGGVDFDSAATNEKESDSHNHMELHLCFSPINKPFVPDNLAWFPQDSQWQRFAESRLKGNILEYDQFISTAETHFVSQSQENDLQMHLKALIAKVNVANHSSSSYELKQTTTTEWKISVKFKPLDEFK